MPSPARLRQTLPTVLLTLAALAASATPAHAAASPAANAGAGPTTAAWEAAPARAMAPGATPAPWWMAFDDATLNLLVHAARQRQSGLQALQTGAQGGLSEGARDGETPAEQADAVKRQVVASYLGARVLSVRWLALNGVRNAADRQRQLLAAAVPAAGSTSATPDPGTTEALASLRQRSERVGQQQQALAGQRGELLQTLATLCGLPTAELTELLAPALAQSSVPTFGSEVPAKLPRSILRARADVAAAEAAVLRSLRSTGSPQHAVLAHMQQPPGWIDADGDATAGGAPLALKTALAPAIPHPELDALNTLLDRAAQEVAHDLRSLGERARLQAERAQLTDASRQAFFAARERLKTGELNELQVLEQYQRLLSESDRYAAACGELAMAWLRLVASTGASEQVLVRR